MHVNILDMTNPVIGFKLKAVSHLFGSKIRTDVSSYYCSLSESLLKRSWFSLADWNILLQKKE